MSNWGRGEEKEKSIRMITTMISSFSMGSAMLQAHCPH